MGSIELIICRLDPSAPFEILLVNGDIPFRASEVMAGQRRRNLAACGLLPNTQHGPDRWSNFVVGAGAGPDQGSNCAVGAEPRHLEDSTSKYSLEECSGTGDDSE